MEEHKLSKLQEAEFDILKTFIRICEENNLRYFLCYGSMIGAVRHQGFFSFVQILPKPHPAVKTRPFSSNNLPMR